MRDGYTEFFEYFKISKSEFFDFGLQSLVLAEKAKAEAAWSKLKSNIRNSGDVYIRSYGRKGSSSDLYLNLYKEVLPNTNIYIDRTNNAKPRQLLEKLTGLAGNPGKRHKPIANYQISHVFGRTKNAFAFTAPWNIVYIPKVLDPFTGHEAKGEMVNEFTQILQSYCFEHFSDLIEDFNALMIEPEFQERIYTAMESTILKSRLTVKRAEYFRTSITSEFLPIEI